MLNKFRQRHMKTCLWILAVVIIVAFGLSGSFSLLSNKKNNVVAKINGKKITVSDFHHYLKLAQLFLLLNVPEENITFSDIENTATDLMLLLWKAKQEKIKVDNQEVAAYIMQNFFPKGNFNQVTYEKFISYLSRRYSLNLTTRNFEESVRELIKVNKLFESLIAIDLDEEAVRELYLKDNQKAEIQYLMIPYDKFKVVIGVDDQEIKDFYEKNKNLFKRDPQVRIRYITITENQLKEKELSSISNTTNLDDLSNKLSLKIKETGYIGINDPIEGIGWQPEINKFAFSLKLNETSPFLRTNEGLIVMEKIAEKKEYTPSLEQIKNEVKDKIILENAKKSAMQLANSITTEIKTGSLKNLKKISSRSNIVYKKIVNIAYNDYIEGLGLDRKISQIIFSLKKGEIYPKAIILKNGVYIIQLNGLTEFDSEDFEKKQSNYRELIKARKEIEAKIDLLEKIKAETDFNFYYTR